MMPVTATPMTLTITTITALNRSATSVMPKGAGHDADLKHLNASRAERDEDRHGRGEDAEGAANATTRSRRLRCGSKCSTIAVSSGSEDRKREQHHARSASDRVDVVRRRGLMDAMSKHERERKDAEPDDDRREDERLRHRIGELISRHACRDQRRLARA